MDRIGARLPDDKLGRWRIPADTPRPADGRASRGFDIAPDRVALFREIDALRDELATVYFPGFSVFSPDSGGAAHICCVVA